MIDVVPLNNKNISLIHLAQGSGHGVSLWRANSGVGRVGGSFLASNELTVSIISILVPDVGGAGARNYGRAAKLITDRPFLNRRILANLARTHLMLRLISL